MAGSAPSGPGTESLIKIFANIFISFIGAGVLGLPFAFKESGIIEGAVIMIAVGFISVKAMLLIIDCKDHLVQKSTSKLKTSPQMNIPMSTKVEKQALLEAEENGNVQFEEPTKPLAPGQELQYGDVGYYAMGNSGKILVDVAIVVSQIGFCCAYLIFISENLSAYFPKVTLACWLLILLPPLYGLCLIRQLSNLAFTSLFAQVSNLMAFAVVFWFDLEHLHRVKVHPKQVSLDGLPFFLCIAIYCYEGAGMILSLEASVHKNIRHNFRRYFVYTLVLVTTLYISFGVCGYMSFGAETNEVITLNLPRGSSLDFAIMVKCCLCLALFFTYPVMMFPVISILAKKFIPSPGEKLWHGNVLRLCLVSLTGLIVMAIPNFATLMGLIGATCCTMIAFTLPGLFHLKICGAQLTRAQRLFDLFLICLGIVGAGIGTLDALQRVQAVHSEDDDVTGVILQAPHDIINTTVAVTHKTIQNVVRNATSVLLPVANSTVFSAVNNSSLGSS